MLLITLSLFSRIETIVKGAATLFDIDLMKLHRQFTLVCYY